MASIEELGQSVGDITVQQANELAAYLDVAERIARNMAGQLAATLEGHQNEQTDEVQERIANIAAGIGGLIGEVGAVQDGGNALLERWGLAAIPLSGSAELSVAPAPVYAAERLADSIDSLEAIPGSKGVGTGILNALRREGLTSLRDIIVVGAANIGSLRNIGSTKVDWLRQALAQGDPPLILPPQTDPARAAQLCPTLADVPILVIGREWEGGLPPSKLIFNMTVEDALTKPPHELYTKWEWDGETQQFVPGEASDHRYRTLKRQAEGYAAAYYAARGQVRPQDAASDA